MHTKSKASILLVILLSLSMVACSVTTVVTEISFAITAIDIAAPVVAVFSGPAATAISGYLTAAANGLNCVLTEANKPGSTVGTVSAAVATCLTSVIVPVMPAGTPQNIVNLINAVGTAIANIIKDFGPKAVPANLKNAPMKLTFWDHHKIHQAQSKLNKAIKTLHK